MKIKLPIFAICFVNLMYLVPSVAVSGMVAAFPGVPEEMLQLLLTLPNLLGIVGILGIPVLTRFFSRKHLAVGGLLLYLLSGVISFCFRESLPVLLLGSGMMGVAYGMGSTLYPLLVSLYFEGEERSRLMGITAGIMQLGRVAAVLAGGMLAELHWYNVYLLFGLHLIPLALTFRWLPQDTVPEEATERRRGSGREGWDLPAILRLSLIGFGFAVCYYVNVTHSSLYIEGAGLGSAALTGVLTAGASILSGALSFVFGSIYRRIGAGAFSLALGVMGLGYLLAGAWVSLPGGVLAICAPAVGIALFNPCLMLELTGTAPQRTLPGATALVLTILNIGYFISPYVVGGLARLLPGIPGAAGRFCTGGALCVVLAFCCMMTERRKSGTAN